MSCTKAGLNAKCGGVQLEAYFEMSTSLCKKKQSYANMFYNITPSSLLPTLLLCHSPSLSLSLTADDHKKTKVCYCCENVSASEHILFFCHLQTHRELGYKAITCWCNMPLSCLPELSYRTTLVHKTHTHKLHSHAAKWGTFAGTSMHRICCFTMHQHRLYPF